MGRDLDGMATLIDGLRTMWALSPEALQFMTDQRRKRPRDPAQLAKFVLDIATGEIEDRPPTPQERGKNPSAVELGKKGGKARADSMSAAKRKQIAKAAAKARWSK